MTIFGLFQVKKCLFVKKDQSEFSLQRFCPYLDMFVKKQANALTTKPAHSKINVYKCSGG